MTAVELLLPVAVLAPLAWLAYRIQPRTPAIIAPGPERVMQSLKEQLRHGEISLDDFRRLTALMN